MNIDFKKPYSTVGGRNPLRYMQGGYGFDGFGVCLGQYDSNGEPLAAPVVQELPVVEEETHSVDEQEPQDTEREALEAQAKALGISFRATLSTDKLRERIAEKQGENDLP